jgi:hypothetical protein
MTIEMVIKYVAWIVFFGVVLYGLYLGLTKMGIM